MARVRLFVTPWTAAYQAPQSMEFFRQEYWSELPFPSPERRHTDGQKAHEKMLSVTKYQRNANEKYHEVSSHTG